MRMSMEWDVRIKCENRLGVGRRVEWEDEHGVGPRVECEMTGEQFFLTDWLLHIYRLGQGILVLASELKELSLPLFIQSHPPCWLHTFVRIFCAGSIRWGLALSHQVFLPA